MTLMKYYEVNRARWNELVDIHAKSQEYDLENFIAGKNSLHRAEQDLLGDVRDKSLLHLQCHFGLDTISWARLGAKVTGIDFSDTAIELAYEISRKTGVDAEFICSNVYDLPKILNRQYDIVFTSIGVLCWLQDINEWGRIIAHFLKPQGTFLLVESHPIMWMFDDESNELKIKYSYWHRDEPMSWETNGTYANEAAEVKNRRTYEWQHTISDVLNSLIRAGLHIEDVKEYPSLPWRYVKEAVKGENGCWSIPGNPLPQMWSVKAAKI
jgi:2-polyprenyl-3-methyl-5-hydroxy-6-metoxy-1,4-benzoquinol methylase